MRSRKPPNAKEVLHCRLGKTHPDFLHLIPEAIDQAGPFALVYDQDPPRYVRELMETLGVEVIVDARISEPEVRRSA